MLSISKTYTAIFPHIPSPFQHRPVRFLATTRSSIDNGNGNGNSITSNDTSPPAKPRITPPDTVEIRFKRGARKRRKQEEDGDKMPSKQASTPKNWDSMTLSEKLVELYVGEKGLLFWLNKFAYASIFIIIGGWILFRFVGPALNLYQLDTPPLSPSSIFK